VKRRNFLSLCGATAGSFLVPDAFARVVRDICVLAGRPLLDAPPNPRLILSAIAIDGGVDAPYLLSIGDPRNPPAQISLLQYIGQFECVDIDDPRAVRRFCLRHLDEPEDETWEQLLSRPISGRNYDRWELWWEGNECPSVIAHRLLSGLPLDDGRGAPAHEPLSDLCFNEGEWHGPWRDYVEAGNLASLACLQDRLNALDQNIAIRIEQW
jgi:hypothetical protein